MPHQAILHRVTLCGVTLLTKTKQHNDSSHNIKYSHNRISIHLFIHSSIQSAQIVEIPTYIAFFIYSFIQSAHIVESPYIRCSLHLFDRLIDLYSFHLPIQINQKKVLYEPYLGVVAVEWRQWQRRRPA
jgi:hypothetical protein